MTKNGVSKSYFVKINTFRLQTSKLLGNRRKTYILDVICYRFYFGEVQEEFHPSTVGKESQYPEQQVYVSINGLFRKKNKQSG